MGTVTLSKMTLRIKTLSVMALTTKGLFVTLSINNTHHNNALPLCWFRIVFIVMRNIMMSVYMLNVVMLSVIVPLIVAFANLLTNFLRSLVGYYKR